MRDGERPSAETALHCQIYDLVPWAGAVVHGHSVEATVLTMRMLGNGIDFTGYEMAKAFEGQLTHEGTLRAPVLDNSQDMILLGQRLASVIADGLVGYLMRGQGAWVWGRDLGHAMANFEGLEFLLACEMEALKLARG